MTELQDDLHLMDLELRRLVACRRRAERMLGQLEPSDRERRLRFLHEAVQLANGALEPRIPVTMLGRRALHLGLRRWMPGEAAWDIADWAEGVVRWHPETGPEWLDKFVQKLGKVRDRLAVEVS